MINLKRILLAFTIAFGSISFAQNTSAKEMGSATVTSDFCVALDAEEGIMEDYVADASALGWTSQAEAKKICGHRSSNLVTYRADYAANKLYIHIHLDRTYESEPLTWWNDYLDQRCQKYKQH